MNAGGPPPPPPPPPIPGIIPSSRLPSEIPARVPVMNPPAALAGAMLKDKKPFTYTPGGLDLSEIKSPRMQRRLYRNAHSEGVRPSPLAQQPPPGPVNPTVAAQSTPHGRAVQVLPMPGMAMGPQPQPQLQHKEPPKPKRNVCGPPPPPPPFVVTSENSFNLASTSTSPPILSSLPTSVPVAEPQLAREPGPSIPVAPPLPTHGPAARCSLISASPPSSPLMNAVPSDPSPPPLPPPQAVRIPVTPPIVPVTPPVVPVTLPMVPVTLPAASVMQPSSPVMQPGSPVMQPSTPVMQPSTPVVQPSTPVVQPGTPIMQPGTPIMQPGTPIMQPSTPVMQPSTPIMQPGTPVIQPGTPIMQPGTPVMQPSTPIMQPSTPAMQPSTPIVQPGTPIIQPGTPIMQPGTPVIPVLPFNARETLCFTLEPTEQPLIECSFTLTSPLKEQALSSDIVISSSMKNDLSPSEEEAFASPEELKSPEITDINIQQNESMLTKAKPSIFEQESIQTIPFEEPSPNKQSPDKEPLPVRHPFKELSPIRQMPIAEPSPITQVPIKETSPIKEVPVISNDSSPIKQDFMKDPSAMKQLITKEPSLVKHPHTKEISPNRQIPIRELSPMKQLYNKEQSPVKQAAVKEPSPVKQAPIKEPSPVKQAPIKEPSPVKQEPIKKPSLMKQAPIKELSSLKQAPKEPSPIKQEPSTEPLPVQQVPLHEHSPAGQGLARQPFPVKHVSVNQPAPTRQTLVPEVSPAEQLPDAQSSIKYSPPPVNIMPLKEPTPVRQLLIKETSPIRQTSLQQPQPVAQSLPAVELHPQSMMDPMPPGPSSVNQKPNQVSNMISGATQKFTFSEQRPARQASMQHPGPARQTSLPEPRQFTEVPIQRLSKQQPTLLRQTSLQDSVLSRQNSVKANNKLTTRHIPVHMELPPYNSGASASPPIVKGASIVRQASLPNKPSSPQVSPPNAQLGSIYVPPVSSDTESTSSPLSPLGERSPRMSPTTGLNKGPLPWMCAQKRTPSPPPSFVTHAQQTQQRLQQHQQNRCLRQRSLGPESPPSQPQVEATVLPQPEVYQHSGFQRQKSLPPQQQQQSQIYPQLIRTQQPRPQYQQPQQSRIIPIQVQQPQQTRTIPIHVQQTQQQQKHRPRERIIPIMIERESPPKNTAQTSTPFIPPAAADSFIPISTDITGSTNAKASFQQPHTSFQQPQASFHQPKASFQQSQPSFQQQQPNLQQSQQYQQPQQWQQYQQAPQQVWSSPGTTFSPPQFSSAPLTESQSGAFHTYNNHHPSGLHSNNNALDALHQMQQSLAQLNSGLQNAFPRLIQKKMSDSITPRTTPSNQPRPQQNGNVATMDQPANGADLGPPIQSRSFRLLQNVLDHQDTAGSDDEISNYMQQCVPQSHAPVHQGVQPRQHYNQIQNQQPIYQRPEIQGQPQQYQQTASNNKQLAQSKQKEVPTSSRFFRMLQTITDTLPEGAEPQGPVHIPNFRQQQKPPQMQQQGQYQQLGQYQQPGQYQQSNQNQQPGGVRSATAADQAVPEPKKYMGGSIPSRSFKMLQAMTNTDDASDDGDPATVSEATSPPDDDKQHAASQIPSPTWKSTVHNSPTSHSPSTLLGTNDTSSDSGISSSSKISPTYTTTKDSKVYRHVSPKITLNRGKDERVVNSALSHTKEPSSPFSQCSSPTWTSNTQAPRFFSPASQTPLGPNENNEDPELDRETPRLMKIIRQESTPHNEQKMTERRYEGGHIPSRVFRHLQTEYPGSSSESNDLQEIKSRTNYNSSCYERGPIPFRVVKSLQNENNNSFDSDASSSYAELDEYYCNGAAKTAVNKETVLKELTSQFDHTGLRRKPKAAPGKVFRYLQAQYDTLDLDKQESQHSNATLQPETEEAHGFGYRGSKVPSPSFKFLQNQYHKQQEDKESVAEETPTPDAPQYEEEPTPYRGARIPGRTFRSLQDNVSAHPSVFKPRQ